MSEIRIIGPRGVGKTVYLASLATFPHRTQFPGLKIESVNEEAKELVRNAENILKQGARLAPSDDVIEYRIDITVPTSRLGIGTKIELSAKDYPGEIFEKLAHSYDWEEVQLYIQEWFGAKGWMVMLTDWDGNQDLSLYKQAFERLIDELDNERANKPALKNLRIAVVMAKCESGEIWTGRLDPGEDLFKIRLPITYDYLTSNTKLNSKNLRFFACSSFGVLGRRNPRPNRVFKIGLGSAEFAVLRKPTAWNPFGLLSPIYWLSTGRRLSNERL